MLPDKAIGIKSVRFSGWHKAGGGQAGYGRTGRRSELAARIIPIAGRKSIEVAGHTVTIRPKLRPQFGP